jgi:putative transposase
MNMSTNTLYYKPVNRKEKDAPVLRLIEDIIKDLPAAGLPMITTMLKSKMVINKKRVHRIMKENNLIGRQKPRKRGKTTDSAHKFEKFANLRKDVETTDLNQVIVGDVTAYDVNGKDHYLALLTDLHNREVIGCAVSDKNNTELVIQALEEAKHKRGSLKNCIHHTDADVRYCADAYICKLKEYEMKISMCVDNVYENAHAESLNKTIKAGEINLSEYESKEESAKCIFSFIEKYNTIRPHSALGGMSPREYTIYLQNLKLIEKEKKI